MNRVERALRSIARNLKSLDCRWALVGGLAVSARAEPRTTRDVDIAIAAADDAEAERLVHALRGAGYRVVNTIEQRATHRLATARLQSVGASRHVVVDLLFASSGIELEVTEDADVLEVLRGFRVPVATVGHLIAMKILARDDRRRPQDWDDLKALLSVAPKKEIERARAALHLIEQRGFARRRNLKRLLATAVRELRDPKPR